ncbi:MAG: carboxypeptidase-like regulatory domain-containing protein [Fuerstiella sp.]
MSGSEIEHQLERLGQTWPGQSVADRVAERLQGTAPSIRSHRLPTPLLYRAIGVLAATIAVVALGFWLRMPQTLQAALRQSLQESNSWHMTFEGFDNGDVMRGEVWFHRDHGFRTELKGQVTVDNGTQSYTWSRTGDDSPVLLRPSMDGVAVVSEMCDLSNIPSDWKKQRQPQLDQEVDGDQCQAFVLGRKANSEGEALDARLVALVDHQTRPRLMIRQRLVRGGWEQQTRITVDYERPIGAAVFEPDYPPDATVVNVQSALKGRFPLTEAAATQEKNGLMFAVHDLIPIDDGTWYVVSSVRGTPEYLQKYPPVKRRLNLNHTAFDVAWQLGSHGSAGSATQLLMFKMEWQGVEYLWRLVYWPHNASQTHGAEPGKLRVPLGAGHIHPDRRGSGDVQLHTSIELDVPIGHADKSTLEEVIAKARIDMQLVSSVFAETGSLLIARSMDENVVQFTSFDKITDEAYAQELRKARWQMQTDNLSGADPPADWVATISDSSDSGSGTGSFSGGTGAEFLDDPLPLPGRVFGGVVDSAERPVANATVTVLVRRFLQEQDGLYQGPEPWSAITDATGQYSIAPSGTIRPNHDEVRIKVIAKGFADVLTDDDEKTVFKGALPRVEMLAGRRIKGRLVDNDGKAVAKAIVRFQFGNEDLSATWDSGPFPVDKDGGFSLSIPSDGLAAAAVYPTGFAPGGLHAKSFAEQDFREVCIIPGCIEPLVLDTNLGC